MLVYLFGWLVFGKGGWFGGGGGCMGLRRGGERAAGVGIYVHGDVGGE